MMRVLAVIAALMLTACSDGVVKIKDPGPVPETTTSTAVDVGAIALKGVTSRTSTSIGVGPGGASLNGTVTGPEGALTNATVHVERLVGAASGAMDVTTRPDGTWTLPMILGGRYRVRAWRTPDLALTKPEVFYLQSSETRAVNLRLDRYEGGAASASIAPDPPVVREPANLFVLVAERTVDAGGVVRSTPIPGATVELVGNGFQLESANPTTTDGKGVAQWRVQCTTVGQPNLAVTVSGGTSLPLTLPACVDTGYVAPATSTTVNTVRTSTTRRRGV